MRRRRGCRRHLAAVGRLEPPRPGHAPDPSAPGILGRWPTCSSSAPASGRSTPARRPGPATVFAAHRAGSPSSASGSPRPPADRCSTSVASARARRARFPTGSRDWPSTTVWARGSWRSARTRRRPRVAGSLQRTRRSTPEPTLLLLVAGAAGPAPAVTISLLTGTEPVALLPRGADGNRQRELGRGGARGARPSAGGAAVPRGRPSDLVDELGSPQLAAATGFVLRCAARRDPGRGRRAGGRRRRPAGLRDHAAGRAVVAASPTPAPTRSPDRVATQLGQAPVLDLGGVTGTAWPRCWHCRSCAPRQHCTPGRPTDG